MHLKHRPITWDEIVGNDHIKNSIKNYKFDVPVIFVGERGSGKTTMTGILVREFGVPDSNVIYFNCGNYRKIDTAREQSEKLYQSSIFGKKKVLILDEIHKLTPDAQDVWLTPLENLPKDVLVFACTTEPNKLIETLYDRFIKYKVYPLNDKESLDLINKVCYKEDIELKDWVKNSIVKKAEGIPRNILTILSKVAGVTGKPDIIRLIETSDADEDDQEVSVLLHKLNCVTYHWKEIKDVLIPLLKTKSASTVRTDLMNMISGKILYSNVTEENLTRLYFILKEADGFLERAELIAALSKFIVTK